MCDVPAAGDGGRSSTCCGGAPLQWRHVHRICLCSCSTAHPAPRRWRPGSIIRIRAMDGMLSKIQFMNTLSHSPSIRKCCFAPVIDKRTRLLILGSLPGDKSLAAQEYYGNRQNQFWRLMSEVIGVELVDLNYAARLATLLAHGVGLWDVVAEAHRSGSLDSSIRNSNDNDLLSLLARYPDIGAMAFNGNTAGKLGLKVLGKHASRYCIYMMPSSSPAHTLAYASKLAVWVALANEI